MSVRPRPALIVPDELSWTMWGEDPWARGLTPASAPEQARALLVSEIVPGPLAAALAAELARVPAPPLVVASRGPAVAGVHVADVLQRPERLAGDRNGKSGTDEGHSGHDGDQGHAGHDMMAIVGEPSSDGLVMEPIELELGPLSVLPGGLVASLRLDGDVVASCELRSTLVAERQDGAPAADPLAPVAWAAAAAVATEQAARAPASSTLAWRRVAAVELERAVSHLAWLRSLGRLLGWTELVARAQRALDPVLRARRAESLEVSADELDDSDARRLVGADRRDLASAAQRGRKLAALLEGRRFAARARGRGGLDDGAALAGPNGRASGSHGDARDGDPLYAELGFTPVLREAGDVEARVVIRAHEVVAAVELATGALERAAAAAEGRRAEGRPADGIAFASPAGAAVEGPRGRVLASRSTAGAPPLVAAPGAGAAAAAAAGAAEGQEWSAALLTIASFDLSAWRVPR